jgi:hypothetical protein
MLTDFGYQITGWWDTPDLTLTAEAQRTRWDELEIDVTTSKMSVLYSVNKGKTWTIAQHIPSNFEGRLKIPLDIDSSTIRFRFIALPDDINADGYLIHPFPSLVTPMDPSD